MKSPTLTSGKTVKLSEMLEFKFTHDLPLESSLGILGRGMVMLEQFVMYVLGAIFLAALAVILKRECDSLQARLREKRAKEMDELICQFNRSYHRRV